MRIVVFGRSGQLATELARQASAAGVTFDVIDRLAADLPAPVSVAQRLRRGSRVRMRWLTPPHGPLWTPPRMRWRTPSMPGPRAKWSGSTPKQACPSSTPSTEPYAALNAAFGITRPDWCAGLDAVLTDLGETA